jgi:hypothetical protein
LSSQAGFAANLTVAYASKLGITPRCRSGLNHNAWMFAKAKNNAIPCRKKRYMSSIGTELVTEESKSHVDSTPSPGDDFSAESLQSTFCEQMVEHLFVAELLQEAWFRHQQVVEVLRSEVDASGYDLVLECAGVLRHVQLKTSRVEAKTAYQKVSMKLAEKVSGCVILILRDAVAADFRLKLSYLFFGNEAKEPLPSLKDYRVAKHSKGDATGTKKERPSIRLVPKSAFQPISTTGDKLAAMGMEELFYCLFGADEAGTSKEFEEPKDE